MKFLKTICLLIVLNSEIIYAHEYNEAFFEIQQDSSALIVKAEFPWTLRPALLKAFPELKEKPSKEDFKKALFEYFSSHIVIKENETILKLKKVEAIDKGHSHSVVYKLHYGSFKESEGLSVTNSCLFELNKDQKNYITYLLPTGKKVTNELTTNNPKLVIR